MLTTYWILETLLVVAAVGSGWAVTSTTRSIHHRRVMVVASVVMIISFTVIKGLRWDRGEDHSVYLSYYTGLSGSYTPDEILFDFTISLFRSAGAPFWVLTAFLSCLFMTSVMALTSRLRRYAVWSLPVMILMAGDASENLIRQFYGISLLLLSSALWLHGEEMGGKCHRLSIASWITLAMVPLVHITGIIPALLITGLRIHSPRSHDLTFNMRVPVILTVLYLTFFAIRFSGVLSAVPDIAAETASCLNLDPSSHWSLYLIEARQWLLPDRSLLDGSAVSLAVKLLWPPIVLVYGYRAVISDRRLRIPYILSAAAILITAMGGDLMVVRRLAWWGSIYIPFVAGGIMMHQFDAITERSSTFSKRIRLHGMVPFCLVGICYILSYVTPFIFRWGLTPCSGHAFIWDL